MSIMNIKNRIIALFMSLVVGCVAVTALRPNITAKAWWWNKQDVIIWQKWVDGSASTLWGPELTYHVMFMDSDYDEYWIGERIRWGALTPYFNPNSTAVGTQVTVEKSLLNRCLHVC
jgi:hypothetical protein